VKAGSERICDRRLPRVVLHLDVDAFFASVEQVLDSALRGRPVIVGSGVVASCSYESRAYGVRTAMQLAEAKRLCPDGVFLAGDYGNYALFANRIEGICRDFTPVVEQASLDDFYLDLTGCTEGSGFRVQGSGASSQQSGVRSQRSALSGQQSAISDQRSSHSSLLTPHCANTLDLACSLQAQIRDETGLGCSLGVGRNKLFSKLASDAAKPGGVIVVRAEDEAEWLARLPVSELPGAGPKVCEELARYNVHTVVQLTALSESILVRLFGANGRALCERARGIDERPVRGEGGERRVEGGGPEGGSKRSVESANSAGSGPPPSALRPSPSSISRETTLERPTADDVFLRGMLSYLVQRATWELRRQRRAAKTLGVKLRYGDFQTVATARTIAEAACEDRTFIELAYELFSRLYTRRLPVRHLGIELSQLKCCDDGQQRLFDGAADRRRRQVRRAVDRVRERFGFQSMVEGATTHLLNHLDQDRRGFRLRTPSLSR